MNNKYRLSELIDWFKNYFEKQLIQSMWQNNFKISHDKYFNKSYLNINELKEQAELVRAEIKTLKENLKLEVDNETNN
jgi:hypothetical protein